MAYYIAYGLSIEHFSFGINLNIKFVIAGSKKAPFMVAATGLVALAGTSSELRVITVVDCEVKAYKYSSTVYFDHVLNFDLNIITLLLAGCIFTNLHVHGLNLIL